MRRLRTTGIMAVLVMVLGLVAGVTPAGATGASYCGLAWGSGVKSGGALSPAPLVTTRTGQDTCWDRVVFEFNGSANGYHVEYGEAYTQGQGLAMSPYTAGGAILAVNLREPSYDSAGHVTYNHQTFDHVANVGGYKTLRDFVYGGSFEGYTTFAVGVRARLPFRVFTLSGPGSHSRIVLDVAHFW